MEEREGGSLRPGSPMGHGPCRLSVLEGTPVLTACRETADEADVPLGRGVGDQVVARHGSSVMLPATAQDAAHFLRQEELGLCWRTQGSRLEVWMSRTQ